MQCETSNLKQLFASLAAFKPVTAPVAEFQRGLGYDKQKLATILKNFSVQGLQVYWNCKSEMFVPTSLVEQTADLKYQIFEAIDAAQLIELMD